eukprot:gnl/TRDRNA2_/TRDRNA2_148960_c0_seq1.p1 gnl/TRDRNA2_/TRDRNA2_148960_c0~~gnl/TRDRNA2_/TRDRNA2_148960_c0_seq1.p1  ORF type:complete len:631 (+),score=58.94 gnl/TRDRNA2_/TRDRNA2_148960_c0_seq1:246-1895(+)
MGAARVSFSEQYRHRDSFDDWAVSRLVNPSSRGRLTYDVIGMIALHYDLVMIPVMLAFNPPANPGFQGIFWFSLIYWTFDIPASCSVGYFDRKGRLEMRFSNVLRHYCTTWFPFDLALVSLDWFFLFLASEDSQSGLAGIGRVARILRVLRCLRLLRLAKLKAIWRSIHDRVDSEYLTIVMHIVKLVLCIVAVNHYIGCSWYALGASTSKPERWTKYMDDEDIDLFHRYLTCLHWSFVQFTPGASPIQPQNSNEMLFVIITLVFALVIFSSFVSSITQAMTRLRNINAQQENHFWKLRKYFRQQNIPRDLSTRVYRYINIVLVKERGRVKPAEVEYLNLISGPLGLELKAELQQPVLSVHPLFYQICTQFKDVLRELCSTSSALEKVMLSRKDTLFSSGREATMMYFVTQGSLGYSVIDRSTGAATEGMPQEVEAGKWCSEAALWTRWAHQGWMVAISECELTSLSSAKFREVVVHFPAQKNVVADWGQRFIEELNDACEVDGPDALSDIPAVYPRCGRGTMTSGIYRFSLDMLRGRSTVQRDSNASGS